MIRPEQSGYDTPAHLEAQRNCMHLIHCAVDARTRADVLAKLDRARAHAVVEVPLYLAALNGPCCLPPAATDGGDR
jgi:hypothetical protein